MAFDSNGFEVMTFADPGMCPLHIERECGCGSETACSDVIISDLDMPNVKGLDFVESLVGKGCHCRHIALMSGGWTDKDRARASRIGCKVFEKPFSVDELVEWAKELAKGIPSDRHLNDRCLNRGAVR